MKKLSIFLFGIAILLCVSFTACSSGLVPDDRTSAIVDEMIPESIARVDLGGGQYNGGWVEPRELLQTEIEELSAWVSQLSLTHRTFEEGESPGDLSGCTGYTFNYNGDETSFTWVDTGTEKYIHYEDEWYEITNTLDAPLDLPS